MYNTCYWSAIFDLCLVGTYWSGGGPLLFCFPTPYFSFCWHPTINSLSSPGKATKSASHFEYVLPCQACSLASYSYVDFRESEREENGTYWSSWLVNACNYSFLHYVLLRSTTIPKIRSILQVRFIRKLDMVDSFSKRTGVDYQLFLLLRLPTLKLYITICSSHYGFYLLLESDIYFFFCVTLWENECIAQ